MSGATPRDGGRQACRRPLCGADGGAAGSCAAGYNRRVPADAVEQAVLAAGELFPRGASVLVACSGGPDSVALAAALARCATALGVRVALGHVDHALRSESACDAEQVREVARRLELPFHLRRLEKLDVSELGLEGAAREARYPALADLAGPARAGRVAT